MKAYDFAPISAREYPTAKILDHPYIWGGVQFCVNVSEKPYTPELEAAMAAHSIEWLHCPVSEEPGSDWVNALDEALTTLSVAHREGMKMVVHCDCGNNRSRTFIEAFYFMLTGQHFHDEYKGEYNHLIYNCKAGHLPEKDIETLINSWRTPKEEIAVPPESIDRKCRFYLMKRDGSFIDIPLSHEEIAYINKKAAENPERYQYAEGVLLALEEMRKEKNL